MKTKLLLFNLSLIIALALFPGCGTTVESHTDGTSVTGTVTNGPIGVTGSWNSETGEWNAGIIITFKEAPTAENIALLKVAGFAPTTVIIARSGEVVASTREYYIAQVDRNNQDQQYAIRKAREAGAVIKPYKP